MAKRIDGKLDGPPLPPKHAACTALPLSESLSWNTARMPLALLNTLPSKLAALSLEIAQCFHPIVASPSTGRKEVDSECPRKDQYERLTTLLADAVACATDAARGFAPAARVKGHPDLARLFGKDAAEICSQAQNVLWTMQNTFREDMLDVWGKVSVTDSLGDKILKAASASLHQLTLNVCAFLATADDEGKLLDTQNMPR